MPRRRDEDDQPAMVFGAAPFLAEGLGENDANSDPNAEDGANGDHVFGGDPRGEADD